MAKSMHLEVIIPTYNRHDSLRRTVMSILNCEQADGLRTTILVVDNNSSDATRETVAQLTAQTGGQVRYYFEGRQGQPAAINAGIAQTSGDLVAFIDDDEEVFPDWLRVIHDKFVNEEIDFLTGRCVPVWHGPIPDWLPPSRYGIVGLVDYGEVPFSITDMNRARMFVGGNSVVRQKRVVQVGGYSEWLTYGNDAEFGIKLANSGATGLYCPELRVYHDIPISRVTKAYVRKRAMMNHMNTVQIRKRWRTLDQLVLGFPVRLAYYKVVKLAEQSWKVATGKTGSWEAFDCELMLWDLLGYARGWSEWDRFWGPRLMR